jgi:glutathione S-transferase
MSYFLAIGDRAYSSWSLRGWLMFARFGLPVTVESAGVYTPELPALLARYGAARTVPALRIEPEGVAVWDSLAIAETLAERHPAAGLWPIDPVARSMAAEMHASFRALRDSCPMNIRRAYAGFEPDAAVWADLARIEALWAAARAVHGGDGPWLFGAYCLADVFFAPVAARIATYGLQVGPAGAAYVAAHLADHAFLEWRAAALADPRPIAAYELDLPERPWPGPER